MRTVTKTQVTLPSLSRLTAVNAGLRPIEALQVGILNSLGSEIVRLVSQIKLFRSELQFLNSQKEQAMQVSPKTSQELSRMMMEARSPVD